MSLHIGMKKAEVLEQARNLSNALQVKVIQFFEQDRDGQISHVNELAILNSIFDGSGKVKMPQDAVVVNINGDTLSECIHKNNDGSTTYSMLYDTNKDGYADGHNMGEYTVKDNISTGWQGKDDNLDGIAERGGYFRANLNDICDTQNIFPILD